MLPVIFRSSLQVIVIIDKNICICYNHLNTVHVEEWRRISMDEHITTAALIIASGKTSGKANFKPDKKIGTITAIERTVVLFQQAGIEKIVVVCGDREDKTPKLVPSMTLTFLNSSERNDMLDNIKLGLTYLQDKCRQVLISYVDVPMFSVSTLQALIDAADKGDVCIPAHNGCGGHPILLHAEHFSEILPYTGKNGLDGAITFSGLKRHFVDVDDPGILSDIQKGKSYEDLLADHDASRLRAAFRFRLLRECAFYGPGAHQLLLLTEETGSLSEACRYMGISYSKGRKIISIIEEQTGYPVLESQQGGKGGGYSRLTEETKELMRRYDAFCIDAQAVFQDLFRKHFDRTDFLKK